MAKEITPELAAKLVCEDHRIRGDIGLLDRKWYYSIEVEPGVFTRGCEFKNVHLTRSLLRNIDVQGRNCLDVGCMEGLVSILMKRRGAAKVTAYDRLNFTPRFQLLREKLNLDLDYITGIPLAQLPAATRERGSHPYDVVVFSGVLYHMFDPLAGLALVRGLVRQGGIILVETGAVLNDQMHMTFNAGGRLYDGGDNYWLVSAACLDYLLRFVRLAPLDCVYFPQHTDPTSKLTLGRLCIACRAVEEPVVEEGDEWIKAQQAKDFREFLNWDDLRGRGPDVPYQVNRPGLVRRGQTGAIDVFKSIRNTAACTVTDLGRQVRLDLGAVA